MDFRIWILDLGYWDATGGMDTGRPQGQSQGQQPLLEEGRWGRANTEARRTEDKHISSSVSANFHFFENEIENRKKVFISMCLNTGKSGSRDIAEQRLQGQ